MTRGAGARTQEAARKALMREKSALQIIGMLLTSGVSGFKPSNIGRFPDFTAARTLLASKESKVNTFAVEQAAAAVPADAWNDVAPTEVWLTLLSPDDASATRKLLREGLCASLRGLSEDHAEALSAMIGALSADFAKCCEYGCLDDCCHDSAKKARAVRAKLSIAALDDARAAQPCPKFHADTVPMRLIATLAGRGTEVLSDSVVDKIGNNGPTTLVDTDIKPHTMTPGDAVVLLGRLAKGGTRRPSVHRSPPPGPPRPGRRVVLVLDEEETAPPPPPGTLRAEVAKSVKKFAITVS